MSQGGAPGGPRPVLSVGRPALLLFALAGALGLVAVVLRVPGPAAAAVPLVAVLVVGLLEALLPLPGPGRPPAPVDALVGDEVRLEAALGDVPFRHAVGCRPTAPPGCRIVPGSMRATETGFAWRIHADRRGRHDALPLVYERSGALGTWGRRVVDDGPAVTVRPAAPRVRARPDARARPATGPTLLQPRRGAGDEFRSLREFMAGDTLAHVNWKATARHGKPIVNEYMPEEPLRVVVYLDNRSGAAEDAGPDAHERSVHLAHGLACVLLDADAHVGLVLLDGSPRMVLPAAGRAHRQRLEDLLLDVRPGPQVPLGSIVAAGTTPPRSVAVLVAADLADTSLVPALELLRARHGRLFLMTAAFPRTGEASMRAAGALLGLDQAAALEALRPWTNGIGSWHDDEPIAAAFMRAGWLRGRA